MPVVLSLHYFPQILRYASANFPRMRPQKNVVQAEVTEIGKKLRKNKQFEERIEVIEKFIKFLYKNKYRGMFNVFEINQIIIDIHTVREIFEKMAWCNVEITEEFHIKRLLFKSGRLLLYSIAGYN